MRPRQLRLRKAHRDFTWMLEHFILTFKLSRDEAISFSISS